MRLRVGLTEKDANLCLQIRDGTTPLAAMCRPRNQFQLESAKR